MINKEFTWMLYEPVSWQKAVGYRVRTDATDCRARVHDEGRSPLSHQCCIKAKETVAGYRFCARHAKRARELEANA